MSSSMLQRRLAENDLERSCARDSSERLQYLEDERLALMLQNAEFLEELRMDEDFMKMLERGKYTTQNLLGITILELYFSAWVLQKN